MWLLTMGVSSMYRSHRSVSEAHQRQIVHIPEGLESILNDPFSDIIQLEEKLVRRDASALEIDTPPQSTENE